MSSPSISISNPKYRSKSLQSGQYIVQGNGEGGFVDYNHNVNKYSNFNFQVNTTNTYYPLNNAMVETGSTADINKSFGEGFFGQTKDIAQTSNTMFKSGSYNVIKVELNTTKTPNEQAINIFYSNDGEFKDAYRKYRTVVPSNSHFYRNYPIENDYFNIGIENLSNEDSNPADLSGKVSLSQYTQYNAPSQTQDLIDRYFFTDASRNVNDFVDDVVLSTDQDGEFKRFADIKPVSVLGITSSITNTDMINWDVNGSFEMTSNTFSDMVLVSDSNSDLNAKFLVDGTGINGVRVQETITCSGTSNTIGTLQYNFIDTIDYLEGGNGNKNVGNISVNRLTDGETLCFSQANSGRSTSLLRVMNEKECGVLKSISLSGRSGLLQKSKYELYHVRRDSDGSFKQKLIFHHFIQDGEVNQVFPLEIQLNPFDRLVGKIVSDATGSLLTGDSNFNAKVDIHIYNVNPSSVRRVNKV